MAKNSKKVRIFSALEVANICGVVNQTAINWIKSQHLKAFTTPGGQYRVYAEDLADFLRSRGMRVPEEILGLVEEDDKSLLIVDDDTELNNMLKEVLSTSLPEVEISQAFDGFEAGQMFFSAKPQLVILDIDLPGVDGHKLCQKIKADDDMGNIKIISVSGLDAETEGQRMLDEGADAFFSKPLDFDALVDKCKSLL